MAVVENRPNHQLLVEVLRRPEQLRSLSSAHILDVLNAAENARLLGWMQNRFDEGLLPPHQPRVLADRLATVRAQVDECNRALAWEFNRVRRAFFGSGIQWVLLKGAGYLAAGVPCGRGRKVADIDVLVAEPDIERAESLLKAQGWASGQLDAYDERYYREWMHELPPLAHRERGSVLDLHHGILPKTSRLRPSPKRLLDRSLTVAGGLQTLSPSHMVLHAAAHLFHDGEVAGAIRDVVDIDVLLRHYGTQESFWADLEEEARALTLTRPAFYAVRYAELMLGTPLSASFRRRYPEWGPPGPVRRVMDQLVRTTLSGDGSAVAAASTLALYIRSHWLKMPPLMLTRHLAHQALRSNRGAS